MGQLVPTPEQTPATLPTTQPPTTPVSSAAKAPTTNAERHALLKSRLKMAQAWAKKPHAAWKKWMDEYNIEDVHNTDEVRDKVRIGHIFRKTESDQAAIFDDQPDLFFKGRLGQNPDLQGVITSTYDYLWDVQNLEEKIEDVALYFKLLGMGFIDSPYVTQNTDVPQDGTVYQVPVVDSPMARVPNPFKVYFSPETNFALVLDYEHCPYYFEERVWTADKIADNYGVQVAAEEKLEVDDIDVQTSMNDDATLQADDMKRVTVYEYYGCLPKEMAPTGSTWRYDKEYHALITKKDEILVEECKYATKPLHCVGNYGLANKFWKFGDAKHLMPLVQELEQYRSKNLDYVRRIANPKPLFSDQTIVDETAFNDPRQGRPVRYTGPIAPTYLVPPPMNNAVEIGIAQVRTDLEKEGGSFDLASGSNQSTVKSPAGIQVFSEAADKNVRRQRKKIARLIRHLIIFQFGQIADNWNPADGKTLEIMGAEQQVTAEILQLFRWVNIHKKIDIEIESLSVNRVQMRQDSLSLLDYALKTPPGIVKLDEIWRDVLQNGFNKKDGDRYLYTDQERAQLNQPKVEPPKVNVSIKADAATPPGAALLENEQLLKPGQAQQAVIDTQVMQQVASQAQGQQQLQQQSVQGQQQGDQHAMDLAHQAATQQMDHSHQKQMAQLGNQHKQEQTFTTAAVNPKPQPAISIPKKGGH